MSAYNVVEIMKRGLYPVYGKNGKLVKSINAVNIDDNIRIRMSDGAIHSKVIKKEA